MKPEQDVAKILSKRKGGDLIKLAKKLDSSQQTVLDRAVQQSLGLNLKSFEYYYGKTIKVLGQRKYQRVKNYPDMNDWFRRMAEQYIKVFGSHYAQMAEDEAFYATTQTIGAIVGADAPPATYHLSPSLGLALIKTDLPSDQLVMMKRALDCGVFVLPKGLLINPDGDSVECITVAYTKPTDETWLNFDERRQKRSISCGLYQKPVIFLMANTKHTFYGTNILFDSDDQPRLEISEIEDGMAVATGGHLQIVQNQDAELQFIASFRDLALQCLLLMQTKPELITTGETLSSSQAMKGKGFGRSSASSDPLLSPNWIGKNYVIKTEGSSKRKKPKGAQVRASPRTHWRRGHYKRVLYGPMDADERPFYMDWREPKLIN